MNIQLTTLNGEEDLKIWYKLYREVFTKDEDNFSYELMKSWVSHNIFLFIEIDGERIGFIFERINQKHKSAIIWYVGLLEEFRGKGIYPEAAKMNDDLLRAQGINIIISETEDPSYYTDEKERIIALKRLNSYVNKIGKSFIVNSSVKYLRRMPPAENADVVDGVQSNYLLGFKVIGEPEGFDFIDKKLGNKISRKDFEKLYVIENLMEWGDADLNMARKKYRAVDEFLRNLQTNSVEYFNLVNIETWQKYLKDNELSF
jgi:hypothetical protein